MTLDTDRGSSAFCYHHVHVGDHVGHQLSATLALMVMMMHRVPAAASQPRCGHHGPHSKAIARPAHRTMAAAAAGPGLAALLFDCDVRWRIRAA
jgi:hypothetical protein